jgi:hypothetical protein
MESNQTAAREARRFLADRVRDDWDWPDRPGSWSQSDEEVRGAIGFQEREYGTTSGSDTDADPATSTGDDPYKFDSPDSIAVVVDSKRENRKRKRREILAEEIVWNEGVACFVRRRDAWTGAASVKKYGPRKNQSGSLGTETGDSSAPTATENGVPDSDPSQSAPPIDVNVEPLVPLARPLLLHNPIRGSISSKIYPDIYSKVVVSARTPSVPINLSDMTRALVQGWKDNGEWPPKAGPPDPLPGGRKRTSALRSTAGKGISAKAHEHDDFLAHHPHVKRGMESVRKMFRLSGSHSDAGPHGQPPPDAPDAG